MAIVGAGDTACEEASYLAKICSKVYMLVRKSEFRASKAMQHRVMNTTNIEVFFNTETDEILGDGKVNGMRIVNKLSGEKKTIDIQGFFVAIGHTPNTQIFKDQLELNQFGYLILQGNTQTSKPGVFAAGDVSDYRYRQAIASAGAGCMAALDAQSFLANAD